MSIVQTFDPDALTDMIKVGAGVGVGFAVHWFWLRAREAEVAWGMALIARFRDGNDDWEQRHKAEFAAAEQPHVTGELVAVTDTPALSAESHEDEQAPAEDDDHSGGWRLAVVAAIWGGAELVQSRTPWGWWRALQEHIAEQRALRDRPDGGEWPTLQEHIADTVVSLRSSGHCDYDIAAELHDLFGAEAAHEIDMLVGYVPPTYAQMCTEPFTGPLRREGVLTDADIAAEIAELTGEPVRPAQWNDSTAIHATVIVGRHRAGA